VLPQAVPAPSGPVVSCAVALTQHLLFLASELDDSMLIRYQPQRQAADSGPAAKRRRLGGWLRAPAVVLCAQSCLLINSVAAGKYAAPQHTRVSAPPQHTCHTHPTCHNFRASASTPLLTSAPAPHTLLPADGSSSLPFSPDTAPAVFGPFSFKPQDKLLNVGPLREIATADLTPASEDGVPADR
jgi:hypothetical protein